MPWPSANSPTPPTASAPEHPGSQEIVPWTTTTPILPTPPQHLLGGLNVAILALAGCRADHVMSTKHSLEELGVNVQILSRARGAVPRAGDIDAVQGIAQADPESFDGVVV